MKHRQTAGVSSEQTLQAEQGARMAVLIPWMIFCQPGRFGVSMERRYCLRKAEMIAVG